LQHNYENLKAKIVISGTLIVGLLCILVEYHVPFIDRISFFPKKLQRTEMVISGNLKAPQE
jgi:hypothetical protein